jgi:hypothetical protein
MLLGPGDRRRFLGSVRRTEVEPASGGQKAVDVGLALLAGLLPPV